MQKLFILVLFTTLLVPTITAQETGFARSGDVNIFYRIFGQGDPLLVINGGPGFSSEGFTELAKKLSEKYRVILFDQRGTGKSVLPSVHNNNISMNLMTNDIEALRVHLDISEWTILGHSFGGMLAYHYSARHPDHVSGLIASSSGGLDLEFLQYFSLNQQLTPAEVDSLSYWNARINEGDTTSYAEKKRREFMAAAYVYHDKNIPEVAERLSQGNSMINELVWRDLQRIRYDMSDELSDFEKPVLIIQGKQDLVNESTARKAYEIFPNAELFLLENCGHYGWLDRPDIYFDKIFSFQTKNF